MTFSSTASTTKTSKINTLQAVRAFAAIGVMLFHGADMINDRLGYLFLNNIFMVGFSGVDVFFVLSGFIILYTFSLAKYDTASFLKRRFIRIYPIYWLVTLFLVVAFVFSPSPDQAHKGDIWVILGSLTLLPQAHTIVGVAWTLSYEVVFYLVFAFTYFKKPIFLLFAFIVWISAILLFYFLHIKTDIFIVNTLMHPVILNFAFGCVVAFLYKKYPNTAHFKWFFWLGALLFISLWALFYQLRTSNAEAFTSDMARVYLFGLPAAILIFGALYLPVLVPKLLVHLGDASYSIYLIHGTVLSVLIKLVIKFNLAALFSHFMGAVALFAATLFIGSCFYRFIELPLLKWLNTVTNKVQYQLA